MRDIFDIIQGRHSARVPFERERQIPEGDLREILDAARWAPTAHNMQNFEVVAIDDPKLLDAIGEIPSPPDEAFIRENYEQLSFDEEELRQKRVGLLGGMFPESWRDPKGLDLAAAMQEKTAHLHDMLRDAPLVLLVTYDSRKRAPASEGDALGLMSLGCVMENMWLMATALGIGFHVVSAFGNEHVGPRIQSMLEIPAPMKIAFGARLGYPLRGAAKGVHVRRYIDEFTHHNVYGKKGRWL